MANLKFCYVCSYDGCKCDKVTPRFKGNILLNESHKEISERYTGLINEDTLNNSWDACEHCDRNHTISGFCYGNLAFDYGEKGFKRL